MGNRRDAFWAQSTSVLVVFLIALAVRLVASRSVPLVEDEHYHIRVANGLSFDPQRLDLQGSGINDHPLLFDYLTKASSEIFGDTPAGWRTLIAVVGSLGILAVYGFGRLALGHGPALLAMTLLAVNQFHVGWSRIAAGETVVHFFVATSLLLFWYGLRTGKQWCVWVNGIVLGLGFLMKENIALLPICYLLFLLVQAEYRPWLKRPCVYGSLVLAGLLVSHEIYWNLTGQSVSLTYTFQQVHQEGWILTARPLSFFLGELMAVLVGESAWTGGMNMFPGWYEWPLMHWIEGLVLLGATLSYFRPRLAPWAKLLLIVFVVNAAASMVLYRVFLFNPFWHPNVCLIPAALFAGHRLYPALKFRLGQIATAVFFSYLAVHLYSFVQIDHSYFKPESVQQSFWYTRRKPDVDRVLLVGLDGVSWELLDRLMDDGAMPNLQSLVRQGARGTLSLAPVDGDERLTPILWTSLVSGTHPEQHGIVDWASAVTENRREPALWNYLEKFGLRALVTNVPGTYPPEAVNGTMISGLPSANTVFPDRHALSCALEKVDDAGDRTTLHANLPFAADLLLRIQLLKGKSRYDEVRLAGDAAGRRYPIDATGWSAWIEWDSAAGPACFRLKLLGELSNPERLYVTPLLLKPSGIAYPRATGRLIGSLDGPYFIGGIPWISTFSEPPDADWQNANYEHIRECMRTRLELERRLAAGSDWALRMHVFTAANHILRRFWRSYQPGEFAVRPDHSLPGAAEKVRETFRTIDDELGRLKQELDSRTWMLLVSTASFLRDPTLSTVHVAPKQTDGIFLLVGPGARAGENVGHIHTLDVAPTVLYTMGLPLYGQLAGRIKQRVFTEEFRATRPVQRVGVFNFERGQQFNPPPRRIDEIVTNHPLNDSRRKDR